MFAISIVEELLGIGSTISSIYLLAILLPGIAITARRLHDMGKSGWLQLLGLIPLVGLLVLVWTIMPSDPAKNEYGPAPKGAKAAK